MLLAYIPVVGDAKTTHEKPYEIMNDKSPSINFMLKVAPCKSLQENLTVCKLTVCLYVKV